MATKHEFTPSSLSEGNYDSDKEVCPFYNRIGACRHGSKCSRAHISPTKSKTVVLRNLYRYIQPHTTQITSNDAENMDIFENFYAEVFTEIESAYGAIAQMHVCQNMGEHLIGNVYVKFLSYSTANHAVASLNDRYFAGLPIYAELSPVENFHDAVCRQHEIGECIRGGFCNFLHVKQISVALENRLFDRYSYPRETFSSCSSSASFYSDSFSMSTCHACSDDTDSSYVHDNVVESSEDEGENTVPKAFRLKPLILPRDSYDVDSDSDIESQIDLYQQIGRRIRWKVFRNTILDKSSVPWDEDAEQQYVFSLIEC